MVRSSALSPEILVDEARFADCDARLAIASASAGVDVQDPVIWLNASNLRRSLIFGTNKATAPDGALCVLDLHGKIRHIVSGLDGPGNVDMAYRFQVGTKRTDIAVVVERGKRRLRIYSVAPDGTRLADISALDECHLLEKEAGATAEPKGLALYRGPRDGAVFAIVGLKTGRQEGCLAQYRLQDNGRGLVAVVPVRRFGQFSGSWGIEEVTADDAFWLRVLRGSTITTRPVRSARALRSSPLVQRDLQDPAPAPVRKAEGV